MHRPHRGAMLSLSTKLTLLIVIVVSLPPVFFTSFVLQRQNRLAWNDLVSSSYEKTVQLATQINTELKSLSAVSNLYYLDRDLNALLQTYQAGGVSADEMQRQCREIASRYNAGMSNRTFSVAIVTPDGRVFGNSSFRSVAQTLDLDSFGWYSELSDSQTKILWRKDAVLDSLFSTNGYPNIYLIRKLHNRSNWSQSGTLILSLSSLELESIYSRYISDEQSLFLLDREKQLLSWEDHLNLRGQLDRLAPWPLGYSGTNTPSGVTKSGLTAYCTVDVTQWTVLVCFDTQTTLQPYRQSSMIYIEFMVVCLAVCMLASYMIIRHYIAPLKTLQDGMAKVEHGKWNNIQLAVVHNDEIGRLTEQFNAMIQSINHLMDQLLAESEAKRNAEISARQYQISPHFLYNTLASVRFMIFSDEKKKADDIILSLIQLMKNALSDSRKLITIDMELHLLESYINIQQYTFTEPFQVIQDIDPELRSCYTIKFLLQPIVENAIFHGLKPRHSGGILRISCTSQMNVIEFRIEDNGVGFDTSAAAPSPRPGREAIGLANVDSRIRLHFGDGFGVQVSSVRDVGTTVTVRIPKLKREEEYTIYEHPDR
jgi:two-component system sensor histidine kinase YesM